MKKLIEEMLDGYEKGSIGRREFVQSLAVITVAPTIKPPPAQPIFRGKTLNHVTLRVSDVGRSKDFYQKLLGLRVREQDKDYCNLDLGGSFLSLNQEAGKAAAIDHFCLGIQGFSVDAVFEKLKKEFPATQPTKENEGTQLYLRDPDNIRLQLCSADYKG